MTPAELEAKAKRRRQILHPCHGPARLARDTHGRFTIACRCGGWVGGPYRTSGMAAGQHGEHRDRQRYPLEVGS